LARLELGVIPEGICLVLQPKGKIRVRETFEADSAIGTNKVSASWKVIDIWRLKANDLLSQNDLGLIPLVPLAMIFWARRIDFARMPKADRTRRARASNGSIPRHHARIGRHGASGQVAEGNLRRR
jgi:hypothetical protein